MPQAAQFLLRLEQLALGGIRVYRDCEVAADPEGFHCLVQVVKGAKWALHVHKRLEWEEESGLVECRKISIFDRSSSGRLQGLCSQLRSGGAVMGLSSDVSSSGARCGNLEYSNQVLKSRQAHTTTECNVGGCVPTQDAAACKVHLEHRRNTITTVTK
ncbi:hypothetical protein CYMTET_19488 [Cymbomonas tetramitiformis]|uniref:Uncharacterized protein n=1 Tax=Cymbomonas tetramitiformis TaxID=36881 RepID=A0AAE0G624_9CHLO|nr:hypothetical protein CYMTET_19488 [Cymbomonas tetramitiformis]